ncbi:S8 family serine peptidase [Altererythrobacter indicus]|uniref:S8 family serine peptidase n=1 Tax=Altericroceibacterium indicum TaxID=374177 RepID=A0A845A8U3_9SPHN|nr:S8 family serine peptidase [Altericroceibacterium indicum]
MTVAVIDSGIDVDSREFAGRISSKSVDIYQDQTNRGFNDEDGHGTHVSMIAAAARDDYGILGMAWNATVMAIRSDRPGSCTESGPASLSSGCAFEDGKVAEAVNYATNNGAKVINISLSGGAAGTALRSAVQNAVNSGVLVVVASGNDGAAQPSGYATSLDNAAAGGVLVVGSVDENGQISDFSNKAGANGENFLTARGENVCCVYENGAIYQSLGSVFLLNGTSFAAPQVAGAAALLAQAFPSLTGRQIAEILIESATDAGATGRDNVYGEGILNLTKAFEPAGTTSLAGSGQALALTDIVGVGSPAMGDALGATSLSAIVLDKYQRAYNVELGSNLRGAGVAERLYGALVGEQRQAAMSSDVASVAFTIDARGAYGELPRLAALRLPNEDAERARILAARVAYRISPNTQFGFAFAQGADGLVAQLQGQSRPAFMIATSADAGEAGLQRKDMSFAFRRQFKGWGLTAKAESGHVVSRSREKVNGIWGRDQDRSKAQTLGLAVDRAIDNWTISVGAEWLQEERTFLGGRFHDSFGIRGTNTAFLDAEAAWSFARNWRFGASIRNGWSKASAGDSVSAGSQLRSQAWSMDIERWGVFGRDDRLAFRIAQPLRVSSGGLKLELPVSYDYDTLSPVYGIREISLAPEGREIMGEMAWRGAFMRGYAAASVYYRHEPGHYANLPADKGIAFRWSTDF